MAIKYAREFMNLCTQVRPALESASSGCLYCMFAMYVCTVMPSQLPVTVPVAHLAQGLFFPTAPPIAQQGYVAQSSVTSFPSALLTCGLRSRSAWARLVRVVQSSAIRFPCSLLTSAFRSRSA